MPKKMLDIGLGQARRICQMPQNDRLAFIAEGRRRSGRRPPRRSFMRKAR
jgi:hypothetical protein